MGGLVLLLQQSLGSHDAVTQARLEVGILLALLHVARDRCTDDLRDRAVFDISHCFQLFRLLFRQPDGHRFRAFHVVHSYRRHPGCQVAWYLGIMQP